MSNYEVQYSYAGECDSISRGGTTWTTGGSNASYNITGLHGAYLNYSITLIAVNDTGRSPPYTDFARTRSTGTCLWSAHAVLIVVYVHECIVVVVMCMHNQVLERYENYHDSFHEALSVSD